jgi:membrane-associated phospholipid phosphatase
MPASRWSDVLVGSCVLLPATLFSQKLIREDWKTFSVMYLQTMMFANFFPLISKGRVQRIRPYVYNDDVPMDNKLDSNARRSFYSGHTTNAFASAVFFSVTYSRYYPDSRWKPYVWGGSLGLASLVGYLRYEAGKHFPTDILMGAAVGSTIGFLIPHLHRNKDSEDGAGLSFSPPHNVGFQLRFDF